MDWLQALILGIIQGLTEYLPVSSSGHLEIGKALLGAERVQGADNVTMSVVLHFGTVLSTLIVLRREIWEILRGALFPPEQEDRQMSMIYIGMIIVSMIPAGIVGFLWEDYLDALFSGNLLLVGCMLPITGLLLLFSDRMKDRNNDLSIFNAFIIGIAQMVALLPGISRSGATLSMAGFLRIEKQQAVTFSFLMVIPLILGKVAKDVLSGTISFDSTTAIPMLVGFLSSLIVGVFACRLMLALVKNSKLLYFAIYCFVAGAAAILLHFL